MKGISSIIAMVLIVLVVISLAGAFMVWSSQAFTDIAEEGTRQQQELSSNVQKGVFIEALKCGTPTNLTIRNTGSSTIAKSDITIAVNETIVDGTLWTGEDPIPAGSIASSISSATTGIRGTIPGTTVRVTIAGGITSTAICP